MNSEQESNEEEEELTPHSQIPENNPMKQWIEKDYFPTRLIIAFLIVITTSVQVILLTKTAVGHSRQFTRVLNYFIL